MAEAPVKTFFTAHNGNEIALGAGVSQEHFIRAMTFLGFNVSEWKGQDKECIDKAAPKYKAKDKIDPPITQPITLWVEGPVPENIFLEAYSYFTVTFGYKAQVIREAFAVSETSHLYGQYVGQREAARRSLREVISSLYAVRHSILNLKTDLERLKEQVKAYKSGEGTGNWDMIKGIFIDNYGGQGKTWNDASRNVPLCKTALSWFLRIKEKDEIDKAIDEKQLNPVVAAYLKRKWEEYENWRGEYKTWLYDAHDQMISLIGEQKQSERLYMKWAKDNLVADKRLDLDFAEVAAKGGGTVEFPRFVPKAAYHTEQFYVKQDTMVEGLMAPWLPCALIAMDLWFNPDLQGWKYVRASIDQYWGSIHKDDLAILQSWVNLDLGQKELTHMLALRAGLRMEEMQTEMDALEKEKVKEKKKGEEGKTPSAEDQTVSMIGDLRKGMGLISNDLMKTLVLPWGADAYERSDVKRMRADAYAQLFFNKYYRAMRNDFQIPVSEA